jgi:hypothetical protein
VRLDQCQKEEDQRFVETRLWSIVAGGVLSLGLVETVFGGDDEQLAEKLETFFGRCRTVSNGDGKSIRS